MRRLFVRALQLKLAGGFVATLALLALAPAADSLFGADGLATAIVAVAALPLVQFPENVASTALLLRGRYDLRGGFLALSMALRLAAIVIGTRFGVWETLLAIVGRPGHRDERRRRRRLDRVQALPVRPEPVRSEDDRSEVVSFVVQSSLATGMLSVRTTLAPLLLGVVAGPTQVGLFRVAQAPQSGLAAASSPVRLVLLTEQTRQWERGEERRVVAGVRRYMKAALGLMIVAVPVFFVLMPWLVRVVFGSEYEGAVAAARIILLAGALQLVLGWTKSLPVTIGRPRLRLLTHGVETVGAAAARRRARLAVGCDGRRRRAARLERRVRRGLGGRPRAPARGGRRPGGVARRAGAAVNVLVVSGIWPPDVGGPASHAPELASFLVGRGHGVEVVTTADAATRASGVPRPLRVARRACGSATRRGRRARGTSRPARRRRLRDEHDAARGRGGRSRAPAGGREGDRRRGVRARPALGSLRRRPRRLSVPSWRSARACLARDADGCAAARRARLLPERVPAGPRRGVGSAARPHLGAAERGAGRAAAPAARRAARRASGSRARRSRSPEG